MSAVFFFISLFFFFFSRTSDWSKIFFEVGLNKKEKARSVLSCVGRVKFGASERQKQYRMWGWIGEMVAPAHRSPHETVRQNWQMIRRFLIDKVPEVQQGQVSFLNLLSVSVSVSVSSPILSHISCFFFHQIEHNIHTIMKVCNSFFYNDSFLSHRIISPLSLGSFGRRGWAFYFLPSRQHSNRFSSPTLFLQEHTSILIPIDLPINDYGTSLPFLIIIFLFVCSRLLGICSE